MSGVKEDKCSALLYIRGPDVFADFCTINATPNDLLCMKTSTCHSRYMQGQLKNIITAEKFVRGSQKVLTWFVRQKFIATLTEPSDRPQEKR